MQFRGPTEKACMASLLSEANLASSSQRSGMNEFGDVKLEAEVLAAHWCTRTSGNQLLPLYESS
jgi:hypothetical protein